MAVFLGIVSLSMNSRPVKAANNVKLYFSIRGMPLHLHTTSRKHGAVHRLLRQNVRLAVRLSLPRMIKMACTLSTMPIVQTKIKAESPTTLRIKFKKKVTFCDFFYFFQKKGCQNLFQLVIYLTVSTRADETNMGG